VNHLNIIEVENLCFDYISYDEDGKEVGRNPVLKDVSLSVPEGQFLAVLGHNGCGKSTLAKHFNAILTPTSGKVTVAGIDTSDEDKLFDIRQTVGMVFQNPENFPASMQIGLDWALTVEQADGEVQNYSKEMLQLYFRNSDPSFDLLFDSQEEAQSYSVEAVPAKEIVRSYVDGSTVRQFLFVVASREFFGDKIRQQLDNLSFYGDFSEWLREQTMAGSLPNLGEGRKVMLMEATTSGYAMAAEASMARYQIQCRMEFFQTR